MANTHSLISSTTLGSSATTINLNSIPGSYTDLKLIISARITGATYGTDIYAAFNGSSANQTGKRMYGYNGGSYSDTTPALGFTTGANATASTFSNVTAYISNYSSSGYKSWTSEIATENNSSTQYLPASFSGTWTSTSPITSIALTSNGNFDTYTTVYLYGIKNS